MSGAADLAAAPATAVDSGRIRRRFAQSEDEIGRDWSAAVRFDLPDEDVWRINANGNPPTSSSRSTGLRK